jgi:hypothetical protein
MKNKSTIYSIIFIIFFTLNTFNVNSNEINNLEEIKIISRKDWGAKPPIQNMIEHKPDKITIHHSGLTYIKKVNIIEKMKALQKYSQSSEKMANGNIKEIWADIPYHFVISGDGEIAEGREIIYSGDTNTEYNPKKHILINILGNFDEQKPTDEQINSLIKLCTYLSKKYNISFEQIQGHNHYAKTACPGKNLSNIITNLKENHNN